MDRSPSGQGLPDGQINFYPGLNALGPGFGRGRNNVKFLKIQVAGAVQSTVNHVKKRDGHTKRRFKPGSLGQKVYPDVKVLPGSDASGLTNRHRNRKEGIGSVFGLFLRTSPFYV